MGDDRRRDRRRGFLSDGQACAAEGELRRYGVEKVAGGCSDTTVRGKGRTRNGGLRKGCTVLDCVGGSPLDSV